MEALIVLAVLALIAIITVFAGVKTVPQGTQWTVERFGRYRATLMPGLNLIIPYVDRIGRKINVQETVLAIPSQSVITRDNATVTVDGVVFYTILEAQKAAYEVANLHSAIINLSLTNIRTAIGSMDLDETLSKRDVINSRLLDVLDRATHPWGVKVTRVELKDVRPPEDVIAAMSQQLTADRQKRAQVLQAEGIRQSEILKAEGQKQAQILAAEGRLEAARRDAEARERLAQAEAAATRSVSEAVASGDVRALNYFVAQKYVEALHAIGAAHNTKLVMLPLEATGVLGAIAGIAELTRDALGGAPKPAAGGPHGSVPQAGGPWTAPRS